MANGPIALSIKLRELTLKLDNQLTQLKVEQGRGIYLGVLIAPDKLPYSMLSLPMQLPPQLLELHDYTAYFGDVSFFFV